MNASHLVAVVLAAKKPLPPVWVIVIIGLGVLVHFYASFWKRLEFFHPFTHRHVRLEAVGSHIRAFFRRGLDKSRMFIVCEQTGDELRFRKTYTCGQRGIQFHMTVGGKEDPLFRRVVAAIETLGLPCQVKSRGMDLVLDVDCLSDANDAVAAADMAIAGLMRAGEASTFRVRVKGHILAVDRYIGGETTLEEIKAIVAQAQAGGDGATPYKWAQYHASLRDWGRSLVTGKLPPCD